MNLLTHRIISDETSVSVTDLSKQWFKLVKEFKILIHVKKKTKEKKNLPLTISSKLSPSAPSPTIMPKFISRPGALSVGYVISWLHTIAFAVVLLGKS